MFTMKIPVRPCMREWHFSLDDEPYPDTYFDFPVR